MRIRSPIDGVLTSVFLLAMMLGSVKSYSVPGWSDQAARLLSCHAVIRDILSARFIALKVVSLR